MSNKLRIVTFNTRCSWEGDGINSFIHRAGGIRTKILCDMPDVIALQEITSKSLPFFEDLLSRDYVILGQRREANYSGEGLYTAIKKSTLEVIHFESFWLSPTPYIPGTRFEIQSKCLRICVVTTVRHKETGKLYQIYNTHLDHKENAAREAGMACIKEQMVKINEKFNASIILLGDFNALPGDGVIAYTADGGKIQLTDITEHIPVSFHAFGKDAIKIDYIFVSSDLVGALKETYVWDYCHEGIYLSDHYPVCTDIEI